jgi:catechol 2,3-dioxygenase-like lactoylglutathione lyase family enzyme
VEGSSFFGVSHVDLAVSRLDRAVRFYVDGAGLSVRTRGEGWADVDGGSLLVRLVETGRSTSRSARGATLRLQAHDVERGLGALLAAGGALVHPAQRTPQHELLAAVRDPDEHTVYVWRPLSEDEYDFVPLLPTELEWRAEADALLRSLLRSVPALFRPLARGRVTKVAEALALEGRSQVTTEEVVRAFILASPRVTRGRNRRPLVEHGIDVAKYQADWDAD